MISAPKECVLRHSPSRGAGSPDVWGIYEPDTGSIQYICADPATKKAALIDVIWNWSVLVPAAFLISVIGFVEPVSVAQMLAAKRRQSIVPDQELIGFGAANLAAAFSG